MGWYWSSGSDSEYFYDWNFFKNDFFFTDTEDHHTEDWAEIT